MTISKKPTLLGIYFGKREHTGDNHRSGDKICVFTDCFSPWTIKQLMVPKAISIHPT